MKEEIRKYGYELGADAVGFAAIEDYKSERSPDPGTVFPGVRSMVVLGYREPNGSLETNNNQVRMGARLGLMEFSLKNNYLMTRYLEDRHGLKAAGITVSYPLNMESRDRGAAGEVSLRHAAVAAGLGVFGRHNLVIHPKFGTRIIFTAILMDQPVPSDPMLTEDLCTNCNLCVETCPSKALDEEGKTDVMKCLGTSQPYGLGAFMRYVKQFIGLAPEEQKNLLKDPKLLSLYQALGLRQQYTCFNCLTVCPAGRAG